MVSVPVVMAVSAALVGIVPATAAAIMVFAATAMVSVMTAAVMTAAVMTATVMTATAMVSVMTAAVMAATVMTATAMVSVMTAAVMTATMMAATVMTATTVLHKRYEAGRDIGFQDRHGGCLCRPRYKTCGDESACKGRRHA
jgi:hypothetical protein